MFVWLDPVLKGHDIRRDREANVSVSLDAYEYLKNVIPHEELDGLHFYAERPEFFKHMKDFKKDRKLKSIRRIEKLAVSITPHKGLDKPPADAEDLVGQVFYTHSVVDDEPTQVVIIHDNGPLYTGGRDIIHVVPIHFNPSWAGPLDIILPRDVFGFEVVVCVGASVGTTKDMLEQCIGIFPEKHVEKIHDFQDWLEGAADDKPDVTTGIDYLDDMDLRYKFYEGELGDRISKLQESYVDEFLKYEG